ncbi:MAG: hypothetical protein IIW77_06270, partial [Bacteroidaceae bacterium]|nr:hypothetical protein [Bacteroidaceae bacterium]
VTSMNSNFGLPVMLPNPPEEKDLQDPPELNERNIMKVFVNMNNEIMVTPGSAAPEQFSIDNLDELRELAKKFITANTPGGIPNEHYPQPKKELHTPKFKDDDNIIHEFPQQYQVNQHVITLQTDRATKYEVYFKVQETLYGAYNDLRREFALECYGDRELTAMEQGWCDNRYINMISEAQPLEIGKRR